MRKFAILLSILFGYIKSIHSASTEVHFIMSDPLATSFYRGFQIGVKTYNEKGQEDWYARVRFSDFDDQICQGKSMMSAKNKFIYGISGGAIIGALSYVCLEKQNTSNLLPSIVSAGFALTSAAFIGIVCPYIYDSLGHFNSKVFIKYKTFGEADILASSLLEEEKDLAISQTNTPEPNHKLIAFGWVLKERINLDTLIHKVREMRINSSFPKYTLYGASCFSDALNCVSFCIRLGNILGIPFEENNELQVYIKNGILEMDEAYNAAATPDRIARILLEDENLCGSGLKTWVNSECAWWVNTTMEKKAKSHVKKKEVP